MQAVHNDQRQILCEVRHNPKDSDRYSCEPQRTGILHEAFNWGRNMLSTRAHLSDLHMALKLPHVDPTNLHRLCYGFGVYSRLMVWVQIVAHIVAEPNHCPEKRKTRNTSRASRQQTYKYLNSNYSHSYQADPSITSSGPASMTRINVKSNA